MRKGTRAQKRIFMLKLRLKQYVGEDKNDE